MLEKKEIRLEDAVLHYRAIKKTYPNSGYMNDATEMYEQIETELQNYTIKS